ncbi:MAG: Fatty acid hydroxylase superfamily protein [Caulobacter sp.]|nr:Fatty acid hydroxylase superfamily protein [Caulobacter sp.]
MSSIPLLAEASRVFWASLVLEIGRYVVTAGLIHLAVFAFWRFGLKHRRIQARSARPGDRARELLTSIRTTAVFAGVGMSLHLAAVAGVLTIYEDMTVRGPAYFAITLVLMILAHDAWYYWSHRAMHHPRLFRLFHRTHHRSRTPSPWTAYAFDVPEALLMVAFVPLWIAIVPMHEDAAFAFMTWQLTRNVMGHAGVELSPVSGRPSRWFGWLNTTTHHDLHHEDPKHNFGLYFSWWDRWMGTEHPDYQARVARKVRAGGGAVIGLLALSLAGAALTPGAAKAADGQAIAGRWATQGFGSIVEFRPCAGTPAAWCGRIVWLWESADEAGRRRTDARNPDTALRSRPLVGVEIVRGLKQTAPGVWSGALYNPDDGRSYSGEVRLRGGRLTLRGCALRVVCKTQTWRRPDEVIAAVRSL